MPYRAITHDSRHPFETYVLLACFIGGMFALFGDLWPGAIEKAFPMWVQTVWGVTFAGGSGGAFLGIMLSKRERGIFLEQIGLTAVAAACFTYSVALLIYNFERGFVTACLFMLVGAASARQWWRLEKFIRQSIEHGRRIRLRHGR